MSSFKIEEKPTPASKAWKRLAKKLRNISQAVRKNLAKRIYMGHRFSRLEKGTNCSTSIANSFEIDPKRNEPLSMDQKSARETTTLTIVDAWEIADSTSLHKVHSIDQKAEEFISKFREELQLEKERSDAEFQEMLARSTCR